MRKPVPAGSSAELIARWRAGDEQAASALWRRYAEQLISLARTRLSKKLARHVDPEDLVQSAYGSFFVAARTDRYILRQSGDLWRLLVAITLHKLQKQFRRHSALKRDMSHESSIEESNNLLKLFAREPSPEEAAALADELDHLMGQIKPSARDIVELCLQGYQVNEIAAITGKHEGTVRRNLQQVKGYLKKRCGSWTEE
jgi:RNA polymerase sigma-70 factor (ECF subfamily)